MSKVEFFNPFPGLRSFEEEEEYLFFGREKQIDELVNKLSKTRFLAVVGASGSGKSSLVKSGLLPSLHSGYLATAGSGWRICTLKPGNDPLGNLSIALSCIEILGEDEENHKTPSIIESILRRSDQGIGEAIKQLSDSHNQNILIVVDQFEELFRFSKYEKSESKGTRDSVIFINLLLAVSKYTDKPIYVVFTMRSDFLGDCTEFRGLPEAINDGQYLIPRMTREERKAAITGPIAVGGAEISQSLLTRLLNDVGDNPDQLPILQHALMRTWDYWYKTNKPDEPVGLEHYEAIGTMSKALSMHAEEAYNEIGDDNGKEICEKLFKSLTEKRDDGRGIRHPGIIKDICELAETDIKELTRIIDIFRMPGRSFLMPPAGTGLTEETIIDISHESLMRVWERLIVWVQEEIESAELYTRLAQSAELYQEGKTGLWRDPELLMAANWQANQNPNEIWAKRYDPSFDRAINFLEYSVAEKDREIKGAERKRKAAKTVRNIFSGVIILLMIFALFQMFKANKSAGLAIAMRDSARVAENMAYNLKKMSDSLAADAILARTAAEDSAKVAKAERNSAILSENKAKEERRKADDSAKVAKEQRGKAIQSGRLAEDEKRKALDSARVANEERLKAKHAESRADRLRMLAEAKNIAIKSEQIINDQKKDEISLQLAIISFCIDSSLQNRVTYNALKKQLTKKYIEKFQERKDFKTTNLKYDERSISFINDTTFITTGDDGRLKKWKISGNLKAISKVGNESKGYTGKFSNLSFSADNNLIITRTTSGNLVAWNNLIINNKITQLLNNGRLFGKQGVYDFSYFIPTTDDNYTIVASFNKVVYVIQIPIKNPDAIKTTFIDNLSSANIKNSACHISKKNTEVIIGYDKTFSQLIIHKDGAIFKKANKKEIEFDLSSKENNTAMAFSKSGHFIAVGGSKGTIKVFVKENSNYEFLDNVDGNISAITSLCFSTNDNDSMLISGSFDQSIHVNKFTPKKVEDLILLESKGWIRSLTLTPDNDFIVAVGQGGLIQIWPTTHQVLLSEIVGLRKDQNQEKFNFYEPLSKDDKDKLEKELGPQLYRNIDDKFGIDNLWKKRLSRINKID